MIVVCCHQPNWLPAMSVIEKIRTADTVIWLDAVQYSKGSFTNRAKMPDGSWLTIPIRRSKLRARIHEIEIDYTHDWVNKHTRTLLQHYGAVAMPFVAELERRPRLLANLNLACLRLLLPDSRSFLQTQLGVTRGTASEKLARMVAMVDGATYLSGPSGREYLDERPFRRRGIRVDYFDRPTDDNPCAMSLLVTA